MNLVEVRGFKYKNAVDIVSSKSVSHRAILIGLISRKDKFIIKDIDISEDIQATLNLACIFGYEYVCLGKNIHLKKVSEVNLENRTIDVGESGTTLRIIIPILLAFGCKNLTITGSGSLVKRPIDNYFELFKDHQIDYEYNGELPLTISGKLKGNTLKIDASTSSQFVSGIIFASVVIPVEIGVQILGDAQSKDYISMTIDMLRDSGIDIVNYNDGYIVKPSMVSIDSIVVEKDYSQLAFFIVLSIINNEIITINNIKESLYQGDYKLIDILTNKGIGFDFINGNLIITPKEIKSFDIDINDIPDLGPILCVLFSQTKGDGTISGIERLKYKESDRITSTVEMLTSFNVEYKTIGDSIIIGGFNKEKKPLTVNGFNDHRIVMSSVIFASISNYNVLITDANAVNKSFPSFFKVMENIGLDFKLH